jgi:hypothetical protein
MVRILVFALVVALGGTSFTNSAANAQGPRQRLDPEY